ncbi:hypothetical protein BDN71DRAFT_1552273 [Pleurotus eryngii]|uniref:RNase H type-1 domain-containing protein n=1 Tax=Pleurotus eryngii TaxID=5323 RepID=A0A9P5ZF94_PLEER|nr:hypothetical protein BDN71DRAFT_1552273 [Pleurotus eryngii]
MIMAAAKKAARLFPERESIGILMDSKYVIKSLTTNLKTNEDRGYIGIENKELLNLTPLLTTGHQGNQMNEEADLLARTGSEKDYPGQMNLEVNNISHTSGAKLQALDQATAYRGIREAKLAKAKHKRERMKPVITIIQDHMKDSTGIAPNEGQIWGTTKNKDFPRQIRFFLWMATHDAYKIGKYWTTTIGGKYTEWSLCTHCNDMIEDMLHILTSCQTPGQAEIWELAKELWTKKGHKWRQPWIGDILACGTRIIKNDEGETQHGDMRFWRILVAESAYLIWKIHCMRVIQDGNQPISQTETMNERLDLDRKMTQNRYSKRATKTRVVLKTWRGVLQNEHELPKNWIDSSGVLVDSDLHTHRENR